MGEPLLYKGLFDLFQQVKAISNKIRILLVTNGILLDETCCHKLISVGVDQVNISLNATSVSSYHKHMGVDAYSKVCKNIENLIKLRNENKGKLPNVVIQYLDYDNQESFQKYMDQWLKIMKYGDKCYVHPVLNQGGLVPEWHGFNFSEERFPCIQPRRVIVVKLNGDMYPCCPSTFSGSQKVPSLYLGNILNISPLQLLTCASSKQTEIIKNMRRDDYSKLPECAICNIYKIGCNSYFKIPRLLRIKGYKWL